MTMSDTQLKDWVSQALVIYLDCEVSAYSNRQIQRCLELVDLL